MDEKFTSQYQGSICMKPTKKGTKSTLSIQSNLQFSFQNCPQNDISSKQGQSNEARYLSTIDQISVSSGEDAEFWRLLYRSVIYLKKENLRTNIDDALLIQQLKNHWDIGMHPEPKDATGQRLLTNGYILAAFSVMMGRLYQSFFICRYVFDYFETSMQINTNMEQFIHYSLQNPSRLLCLDKEGKARDKKQKLIFRGQKRLLPVQELLKSTNSNDDNDFLIEIAI